MLLWRYLPADGWDRLTEDCRLPVTRIAGFGDGFECAVPVFVQGHLTEYDPDLVIELSNSAALQRRKFASCWFADEHESVAMWNLFVGRQPGVAIAVLFADLQGLVPLGGRLLPVQYVRHDDATADLPLDRPELWPFYKLWGYRHEREVRLVVPATWDLVEPTDDEGRWGRVLDTDLLSILRSIRVFAPNKSDCDELLDRVSNASHGAEVTRTRAYPRLFRRGSDDWWIEGMEPEPDWRQRMMPVSSPIAPEPE